MLEAPVAPVGVPALLAEYRREKRAAPSMMTHSVGSAAPVSRKAAELAASELRSILGQQGPTAQDAGTCGTDTSPQPLSPRVTCHTVLDTFTTRYTISGNTRRT